MAAFLLSLSLIFLTACGVEIQDREREQEPISRLSDSERVAEIPLQGPGYRIHEGEGSGVYSLELNLPPETRYLERLEIEGLKTIKKWTLSTSDTPQVSFRDSEVQSGGAYEYRFFHVPEREISRIQIQIPRDESINGKFNPLNLLEGKPLRRLFLGPQAELISENRNVSLQTEFLFAEPGAKWMTFPKETTATAGQSGRSGGQLKLRARRAFGVLDIFMRGERGGDGIPGGILPQAAGGESISPSFSNIDINTSCRNLRPGGPGKNGAPGLPGGNGGAGGHTGSLEIDIQDSQNFKVAVHFEAGSGGAKGKGGPGQAGGPAGQSEIRTIEAERRGPDRFGTSSYQCPVPDSGGPGQNGPPGEDGREGEPGRQGLYCLRQNSVCR